MSMIISIREEDVIDSPTPVPDTYRERLSARAVVFNDEGHVVLLHVSKKGYYKLPGGGVKEGETIEEGLLRECREEIGYDVRIEKKLGTTEAFRNKLGVHQTSHCFIAAIIEDIGEPNLTEIETTEGFEYVWLSPEDAVRKMQVVPDDYVGRFVVKRDLAVLQAVLSNTPG